jgi:hypothetical protein
MAVGANRAAGRIRHPAVERHPGEDEFAGTDLVSAREQRECWRADDRGIRVVSPGPRTRVAMIVYIHDVWSLLTVSVLADITCPPG